MINVEKHGVIFNIRDREKFIHSRHDDVFGSEYNLQNSIIPSTLTLIALEPNIS